MYDESEVPLDVIIDLVQHVHAYEGEGAILIFLSGWEEISAVRFYLCTVVPFHDLTYYWRKRNFFSITGGHSK